MKLNKIWQKKLIKHLFKIIKKLLTCSSYNKKKKILTMKNYLRI